MCTLLHVDHTITYFTFAGMFIPWNCNRPSILRFQSGRKFTFTHLKNKNTNKNISEIRTFTDFYGPRSEIRTNTDQYGLVRILRTSWPPWSPPPTQHGLKAMVKMKKVVKGDQCNLFPPPQRKMGEQVHKLFSRENDLMHCHKRLLVILVMNCIVLKH